MLFRHLPTAFALAAYAAAAPAPQSHVLHEKRSSPGGDWVRGARVDRETFLPMRIGLTQANLEKGEDYLLQV